MARQLTKKDVTKAIEVLDKLIDIVEQDYDSNDATRALVGELTEAKARFWHHLLSPKCKGFDIDFVERRGDKIVAIVEYKMNGKKPRLYPGCPTSYKIHVAHKLGVVFYVVIFGKTNEEPKTIFIPQLGSKEKVMTWDEYQNFKENLPKSFHKLCEELRRN